MQYDLFAMQRMYEAGVSAHDIARELKTTRDAVYGNARRHGWERTPDFRERVYEARRAALLQNCRSGKEEKRPGALMTDDQIAALYAGQRYEDVRLKPSTQPVTFRAPRPLAHSPTSSSAAWACA